jgi:broad specificity phosphatase PhoE
MLEIIALRHLPTPWNKVERLQGRADQPIDAPSAADFASIERNLTVLAKLRPFDAVLCSSLQRTRQTAEAYGFSEVVVDPLLDEFDFGRFEGCQREELLAEVGQIWLEEPHTLVLGESMSTLENRIRRFVARNRAAKRVLIFGHGCWLRALLSLERRGDLADTNRIALEKNTILYVRLAC